MAVCNVMAGQCEGQCVQWRVVVQGGVVQGVVWID